MAESWKDVAQALAIRLNHATFEHEPPDDCPYCEDARAYQRYVAKVASTGRVLHDPLAGATEVALHEIPVTYECTACGSTVRGTRADAEAHERGHRGEPLRLTLEMPEGVTEADIEPQPPTDWNSIPQQIADLAARACPRCGSVQCPPDRCQFHDPKETR